MNKIKELEETLKSKKFEDRYPHFDTDDGKIHILYISPCLNGTGYYRAIAPSLELNNTESHSAIISSIHKWNFNKQFDDYDSPLDERLIKWAHYVVLPLMFTDAGYILKALYEINDDIQFVMDLDFNFHKIPEKHPDFSRITKEMKGQLIRNISNMEIVTGVSEGLLDYYEMLLEKQFPNSTVFLEYLPNLVSQFGYADVKPLKKNAGKKVRIGLIGNAASAHDVFSILDELKAVQEKHGDKIEFILFGWDGKTKERDLQDDLKVTTVKSVSFVDYFNKLNELSLDLALLPFADIPFNTHGKSPVRFFELAVFGIPVIASDMEPYSLEIEPQETGLLAQDSEQWISAIDALISDEALRKRIGKSALRAVWRNNGFTTANLRAYQELFI
ncbi:glycosyltransferase [Fulvivirgaceae bacterium BMA10]|uniref:Glycosyltransferase n=1 Tax=Splendidivirga corallicola TaxID=3051826 RepID=A0ABT8KKC0_9BACT|nr:glycosyltransferase [Fulvivirgaceae bacterium BMA10]